MKTIFFLLLLSQSVFAQKIESSYIEKYGETSYNNLIANFNKLKTDSLHSLLESFPTSILLKKSAYEISQSDNSKEEYDEIVVGAFITFSIISIRNKKDIKPIDYYNIAWVSEIVGEYEYAIVNCTKALNLKNNESTYPKRLIVYNLRGQCKMKLEDFYGAILDFTECINIPIDTTTKYFWENEKHTFYLDRGLCLANLKDYLAAIKDFDKAIELNKRKKKDGRAYYYRGLSHIYLGEKVEGCIDLSKAGELGILKSYEAIKELCQ
ncbi:MAG: tetratricopeptide repeat protein [Bacteroidia bacterium]|nr:tetratricopeptide repeat protein [Bacteroidia bacterium]MCF8446342.1 tetratricopeptide repeat protein [Bacteroidia bacterium]